MSGRTLSCFFFFFQAEDGIRDVAVTGVQTCALPISHLRREGPDRRARRTGDADLLSRRPVRVRLFVLQPGDGRDHGEGSPDRWPDPPGESVLPQQDRKSTRLNSSHGYISYAVFCLKKKKSIH